MLTHDRRFWFICASMLVAVGLIAPTAISSQKSPEKTPAAPARRVLERFIGAWTFTEHHYDATGKVIATVKGTEQVAWVLDERAIQRTYISKSESRTFRAIGLLTWNEFEGRYHGSWLDNLSRGGPTIVQGDWDPNTNTMAFKYAVSTVEKVAREFQVVERFLDDATRIATTFETTGDTVQKRTEVQYKRAVPCPAKLRFVPDIGG